MTAHITVANYGARTRLICEDCDLEQPYDRWKPAVEAAHQHDHDQHPATTGAPE